MALIGRKSFWISLFFQIPERKSSIPKHFSCHFIDAGQSSKAGGLNLKEKTYPIIRKV
jgi:hypothetical protein